MTTTNSPPNITAEVVPSTSALVPPPQPESRWPAYSTAPTSKYHSSMMSMEHHHYDCSSNSDFGSSNSPDDESGLHMADDANFFASRKQREFIPENRKDDHYWEKRRKNNEAARRSREKRRMHDYTLENRIGELSKDNTELRAELMSIKAKFGVPLNETIKLKESELRELAVNLPRATLPPGYSTMPGAGAMCMPTSGMGIGHPNAQSLMSYNNPLAVPVGGLMKNSASALQMFVNLSTSSMTNPTHPRDTGRVTSSPSDMSTHIVPSSHGQPNAMIKTEPQSIGNSQQISSATTVDTNARMFSRIPTTNGIAPVIPVPYGHPNVDPRLLQLALAAGASNHPRPSANNASNTWYMSTSDVSDDDSGSDGPPSVDRPLSLTMVKSEDSRYHDSGDGRYHDSGDELLSENEQLSTTTPPPLMALPLKLRHKMAAADASQVPFIHPYNNGLTQLSEIALAQAETRPMMNKETSGSRKMGRRYSSASGREIDPKYVERRRRNNEAARKCRENRKTLTQVREVKSEYLEVENNKLRNELDGLQEEMKQLRELLEKKRLEQASKDNGEPKGNHI